MIVRVFAPIISFSANYNFHVCFLCFSESGRLEFGEFVQLAAKFIVEEDAEAMQKELREAFRLYDKQGNGFIPTTCLKEILKELDDQLTEQELDIMIEEIDSDGSGTVDFDGEYDTWVNRIFGFIHSNRLLSTHPHVAIINCYSSS